MKLAGIWALLVAGLLALGTVFFSSDVKAQTATGPRLGFVNVKLVLSEAKIFKDQGEKLRSARDNAQQQLDERADKLKAQQAELERKKDLLPTDEYSKQRTNLQKELIDFRALKQQKESQIDTMLKETLKPLLEQLNNTVETVAKEKGFDFIFKKKNLAYGAAQFDITKEVIDRLNKQ